MTIHIYYVEYKIYITQVWTSKIIIESYGGKLLSDKLFILVIKSLNFFQIYDYKQSM